jgi:uncharacterized protein YqgC (DUF456 family)
LSVLIAQENNLFLDPSHNNVLEESGYIKSCSSGHGVKVTGKEKLVNNLTTSPLGVVFSPIPGYNSGVMWGQIILWIIVTALFAIGLAGTVLPTLPGNVLIFAGALVYAIFTEFEEVTLWVLAVLAGISIGSQVLDYVAGAYGAKRFGASKYGIWGAIIGGILGFVILNIVGLIVGVFMGAVIPEMLLGQSPRGALRVGWGSLLGFLGGTLMKFILGLVTIGIFFFALVS